MPDLLQALQSYFGYSSFIPPQDEIIEDILAGRDVFVSMPTGGGKSLCYQLPALMMEGMAVVISPLIALMKDQVDGLRSKKIPAACINSSMAFEEVSALKSELINGSIKLLYLAPERLMLRDFLSFIKSLKINLIAIDEAHCISEWGPDFRPAYRQLKLLRENFPKVPMMTLTATAIPEVQRDIIRQLKLSDPKVHKTSFNRPNLFYQVRPKKDAYNQILSYLKENHDKSGIVYCTSRSSADSLSKRLAEDGCSILPFHAGIDPLIKAHTQDSFINGDVKAIAATIAFGMGIDKPDIRFVIHYDLPKDLETFYQETGRAGRDGQKSDCILFFSSGDARKMGYLIDKKSDERQRWVAKRKLSEMVSFCESRICRRKALLEYFKEPYDNQNCGNCDNCLELDKTRQEIDPARKILSCVSELKEGWGAGHVVDILRGSKGQKVIAKDHHLLEYYGKGSDRSAREWRSNISKLIQTGYLCQVGDRYPVLKLTEKGLEAFSGKGKIEIPGSNCQENQDDSQNGSSDHSDSGIDPELFEALRRLRRKMAQEQKVPPYLIFHDSSLKAMAIHHPRSLSEFSQINGVGSVKLERYGDLFVKEIEDHCQKYALQSSYANTFSFNNLSHNNLPHSDSQQADPKAPNRISKRVSRDYKHMAKEDFESWFYDYNSWSFTRHKIWSRCRRAYYYSYIKIGLKGISESERSRIKELKSLKPKAALQGMLIHKVIEDQIDRRRSGQAMSEPDAAQEYSTLIEECRGKAKEIITEHYNNLPVDASFFDGILADGRNQIGIFFNTIWPKLEAAEYLAHERLNNFHMGDTAVAIKLDYLSRDSDGFLVLSDWKTGRGGDRIESETQIGSYVLWALEKFKVQPQEVKSQLIYLKDGSIKEYEFSKESLDEVKATIQESFEEMNRTADIEYFYPNPHPNKCLSCQFSAICRSSEFGCTASSEEVHSNNNSNKGIIGSKSIQLEADQITAKIDDLQRRLSALELRCENCLNNRYHLL